MTSLGQVAEVATAHLGIQAAPRPGRLRLPQTWLFMVPVANLAKSVETKMFTCNRRYLQSLPEHSRASTDQY